MRIFSIKVSKCSECPYVDYPYESHGGICVEVEENGMTTYNKNKNGITPSCPMYESSVEVEG